ncbi:MAG: ZPR1 zinc finger domain-containing protein [Candidatus Thermoplasmatota archaeon]|nr:ZPR1 zinc finger domain-containing protein [Candidatus Thermoplasmatota archaeon]
MAVTILDTPCPVCGEKKLEYRVERLDIPHFGETLQTTLMCQGCDYKTTDTLIVSQKEPTRYEIFVDSEDDMMVRVIRSTSGTIKFPDLGITVEPTPLSESFISNVEGVLNRVKDVLMQAIDGADTESQKLLGKRLAETIELVRNGKQPTTFILDDPFGNSAIVSEKVKKRLLTEEEVRELKIGMFVLEK